MKNKIILTILILSVVALIFSGCDGGSSVTPPISDNGEISDYFRLDVPYIEQNSNNTCLPSSAAMILKYYEDPRDIAEIRDKLALPWQEDGTGGIMVLDDNGKWFGNIEKLFDYVKSLGFNTKKEWNGLTIVEMKDKLKEGFPIIVLQDFYLDPNKETDGHFSVIVGYREIGDNDEENKLIINDPWSSRGQYWEVTYSDFKIRNSNWWKENYNRNSDLSHSYIIWKDTSITNTHTITASAGSHGSISPSGNVTVNQGSDKLFIIIPDTGYSIDDVLVDGSSVGAVSSYTFINVTENHTISATFTVVAGLVHNISKDTYYNTIQAALDDADNNNTIEVADGIYPENVDVNKDHLTIRSENGADSTIVQAARSNDYVFDVRANYVNITGFTVTGATVWENEEPASGIYLQEANYCTIINNSALNDYFGIFLKHSNSCKITNNTVSGNPSGCGIYLIYSTDNSIADNTISNKLQGIFLESSSSNNLTGNTANSNTYNGICFYSSNDNKLMRNTAMGNGTAGIREGHYAGYTSTNNTIYLNNAQNACSEGSADLWNSPEEITYTYNGTTYTNYLGNYWSDYTGSDTNGDGIGDTPYIVDGDQDSYPLMEPFENYY
jgi:parallel beta-helix repeat protein